MRVSLNLKYLMDEQNLSVKELSQKTGINVSLIYDYLNGRKLLSLNTAIILGNFFSCSIDYLLGLTDVTTMPTFPENYNFYDSYKKILKRKNLSNREVTSALKIGKNRPSDWKKGSQPSLASIVSLSKFLDVSVEELIGRE